MKTKTIIETAIAIAAIFIGIDIANRVITMVQKANGQTQA